MQILLTGATGFIGSHILKGLLESGHTICIVVRKHSKMDRIRDMLEKCIIYNLGEATLGQAFEENQFECVVHSATYYGRAGQDDLENIESNLIFPLKLLHCAIEHGVPYFINTDSFFCKQLALEQALDRELYMYGYILSKNQFRQWGRALAAKYGITFINMQLEHVYGEGDSVSKFVPYVLNQCKKNVPVLELSDGTQKRDFIHISDVVRAYQAVISNLKKFEHDTYVACEVGTGKERSLREFVEMIHSSVHSTTKLDWGGVHMKKGEMMKSRADHTLLLNLGWEPQVVEDADIGHIFDNYSGGGI